MSKRTFTLEQIEEAGEMDAGFCLSCGYMQEGCEPDAREYTCDACDSKQVYGAEELVIMGLVE